MQKHCGVTFHKQTFHKWLFHICKIRILISSLHLNLCTFIAHVHLCMLWFVSSYIGKYVARYLDHVQWLPDTLISLLVLCAEIDHKLGLFLVMHKYLHIYVTGTRNGLTRMFDCIISGTWVFLSLIEVLATYCM